jgi:hypothetical protein
MQPSDFFAYNRLLSAVDSREEHLKQSARGRSVPVFGLILIGVAAAGWWAGLAWAAVWLTIRTLS